jgi:hypothetical protein
MDCDKWGHLTTSSNLESVKSSRKVVWVATDNLGKRVLEFDWHQVSRESLAAGLDSGRNHGPGQRKDFASVETSSVDFPNRTWIVGHPLYSKDFGKDYPMSVP